MRADKFAWTAGIEPFGVNENRPPGASLRAASGRVWNLPRSLSGGQGHTRLQGRGHADIPLALLAPPARPAIHVKFLSCLLMMVGVSLQPGNGISRGCSPALSRANAYGERLAVACDGQGQRMLSRWPSAANSPDAVQHRRVVVGRQAAGELHTPQAGRVVGRELVSVQGADPDEEFKALQMGVDRGQVSSC